MYMLRTVCRKRQFNGLFVWPWTPSRDVHGLTRDNRAGLIPVELISCGWTSVYAVLRGCSVTEDIAVSIIANISAVILSYHHHPYVFSFHTFFILSNIHNKNLRKTIVCLAVDNLTRYCRLNGPSSLPIDQMIKHRDSVTNWCQTTPHLALSAGTPQRMAWGLYVNERRVLLEVTAFCL